MNFISYLKSSAELLEKTGTEALAEKVTTAVRIISKAIRDNRPLLICGNGGSAADALHISAELVGRFAKERRPFKAIALNANQSVLTAWYNDYSYETVFARQVEAFGEENSVLLGLSTSGNSPNVVSAFQKARELKMSTIALTGRGGGKLASISDVLIDVPSVSTPMIQQAHICIYHFICERVEAECATADPAVRQ